MLEHRRVVAVLALASLAVSMSAAASLVATGDPVASAREPVAGAHEPVADAGAALAGPQKPVAGTGEPVAGVRELGAGAQEPDLTLDPRTVVPAALQPENRTLGGDRMEEIAPGQPVNLSVRYDGLGPGRHQILVELRDPSARNASYRTVVTAVGDEGTVSRVLDASSFEGTSFRADRTVSIAAETTTAGGRPVTARCRETARTACTLLKRTTTMYVDNELSDVADEPHGRFGVIRATEGEPVDGLVYYGWSSLDLLFVDLYVDRPDYFATTNLTDVLVAGASGDAVLVGRDNVFAGRTPAWVPSRYDGTRYRIQLRPSRDSWGTKGTSRQVVVNENPELLAVRLNGTLLRDDDPPSVRSGQTLTLTSEVRDPERGDLTCQWHVDGLEVYRGGCGTPVALDVETGRLLGVETVPVRIVVYDGDGGRDSATRLITVRSAFGPVPAWALPAVLSGLVFPLVLRYVVRRWEARKEEAGERTGDAADSQRR